MQLYPELKRDEIVAEFLHDRYFKLPSLSYHVSGEEGCVRGQAGRRGWDFGGRWSCSCSKSCVICHEGKSCFTFVQWDGWCNWKCNYTHVDWSSPCPDTCQQASLGETRLDFQSLKRVKQPVTTML